MVCGPFPPSGHGISLPVLRLTVRMTVVPQTIVRGHPLNPVGPMYLTPRSREAFSQSVPHPSMRKPKTYMSGG